MLVEHLLYVKRCAREAMVKETDGSDPLEYLQFCGEHGGSGYG